MDPIIEMNNELVQEAETEVPINSKKDIEIKKNSKKDIINRIFEVCEKYNLKINETEVQLARKTRKILLEMLADYIEQSMANKIKSDQNGIPDDCQTSEYAAKLPILRLAHGFFASLLEKGFNASCSWMDWSYELRGYASSCSKSLMIDQVLIDIAEDMGEDIFKYMSNPYLRLAFIHTTSMMSTVHRIDKEQMNSPRFKINELNMS